MASQTITFRPSIAPETLEREAKRLHFKDRTELINAAIMAMLTDSDKLRSSKHADVGSKNIPDSARHHLLMTILKATYKYEEQTGGWDFKKPRPAEATAIKKDVKAMKSGKTKTIASQELIAHLSKL